MIKESGYQPSVFGILFSLNISQTIFGCAKKVDIEAEKETLIKMSVVDWDKNVKSGNIEANAETYIDNAIRIETDGTMLVGKEVITKSFKTFLEQYNVE